MKKILVAEDNKLILETISRNLLREDYEVFKVDDGKECLKFLDMNMDFLILFLM